MMKWQRYYNDGEELWVRKRWLFTNLRRVGPRTLIWRSGPKVWKEFITYNDSMQALKKYAQGTDYARVLVQRRN